MFIKARRLRDLGILGMNKRNVEYINRFNPRHRYPLVDNKLRTKLIAQKAGLPVPDLLHVVTAQYEIESIESSLHELSEFVIKPAQGSGGKGILVIHGQEDDGYIKSNGAKVNALDVKRHLTNIISGLHSLGGRTDLALIEALVRTDPLFGHISHEGVPDIRLIVFKGYPVMGMLRLATKASDGKANLHQGAIGVGLDIGSGRGLAAVQHNRHITHHPDTGASLADITVPYWTVLLRLAARCYEVTQLGYLGCDIVIDEHRGPLLLELNARPGLSIQIANDRGLLPRLNQIETIEAFAPSLDARVEYAMTHFSDHSPHEQTQLWEAKSSIERGDASI
jgi:alpha-L-glutamate ligase-like protein